jgi:hypothetical protein
MLVKLRGPWQHMEVAREMDSVGKIAQAWVRSIEAMEKHRTHLHAIRYEDLVGNPREQLDALASFLEIDPTGFRDEIVRDTSIGKYRKGLTSDELGQVIAVTGPTLSRLGYT